MKIILPNFFEKRNTQPQQEKRSLLGGVSLTYGTGTSQTATQSMQLSAVYRAVECITDSVASMPFEVIKTLPDGSKEVDYSHSSYELLNKQPNKIQSRFTFIKTLVTNVLLNGNGYARIIRDSNGNAIELRLLNPTEVTMFISQDESTTYYSHKSSKNYIASEDMIHVLNFSYDGLRGVSTLQHAATTTSTATAADLQAKGFFAGGANLSGLLKVNSKLDDGQAAEIQAAWRKTLSGETGTPNGIVVIEGDMEFQPVSISPADAQMLESRQFSVLEIARFFGVSPIKLFDTTASTYSNVENAQLSFLTDTISPLVEKLENEFNRKLFRPSESKFMECRFDVAQLLRADLMTQADYYSKLFNIAGFTPNEIRKKLGNPTVNDSNADKLYIQSSLLPIDYDFKLKDNLDNKVKV